jgi:hypothetical protein
MNDVSLSKSFLFLSGTPCPIFVDLYIIIHKFFQITLIIVPIFSIIVPKCNIFASPAANRAAADWLPSLRWGAGGKLPYL